MYIKFEPGKNCPSINAETAQNIETFDNAGYLLTDDDLVIEINALTREQINYLVDKLGIRTEIVYTDHGANFYFKKYHGFRGASAISVLGFEVTYKHKANTDAVTVKQNGKALEVVNHGKREPFPDFFRACRKSENLLGLTAEDERDKKLFWHRELIEKYPLWMTYIEIINEHIFAEPLPANELRNITRDMNIQAVEDGESDIAEAMIDDMKIVSYRGQLWFRPTLLDWYRQNDDELRRYIFMYCYGQKRRYLEEVFYQIGVRLKPISEEQVFDIRLKNGTLRDGKFIETLSDDFTPYFIDIPYHNECDPVPMIDNYLNNLTSNDGGYRKVIEEILGYTLFTNKERIRAISKFFFFVGDGGNGKGTLLQIIRKILGNENISSLSVEQLADERYVYALLGKLVNLGDDVEDAPINGREMRTLKNISTADNISLRPLYKAPVFTSLSTTLIFTTNHVLKSFEKSEAYKRRVVWCPMYNKPKKPSATFISDITTPEALKYWLKLMVDGYVRLYKQNAFTNSQTLNDFNKNYHEENNSILEYIHYNKPEKIVGKTSPDAYEEYRVWAERNDYNVQSKRVFKDTLENELGLALTVTYVDGKSKRVFQVIPPK